ncbi:MAG TPA: gamma carbonic anhydrase family protein [Candidatus Rifleibacterium sp.]|nr:gamma carbonic anhydrase family protein [Candidatus Rifleibacterium sp.]HPT44994.1 gamma carbonic anhydrase family protein [Candidatus Rifleibacterium sp.]
MLREFCGKRPVVPGSCFVACSADLVGDITLGENANIWYGTVIRGDINSISIGADTNIQDGSVVHVDRITGKPGSGAVKIGCNVTVGHRAVIHACEIGDNCLIGMGAIVLSGAVVGEGSVLAAGSVVRENEIIPPGSLVAGVPAKIKSQVGPEWQQRLRESAEHYVSLGRQHKNSTRVLE